ncbi:hypothetical protein [Actinophytocola sp.]|uniref:hypothetical protein n=1 Tax=Actinophytocola sp. TaxID=1872138 RepID=UPI002D6ADBC2|nr:hypothetical protein [Actinophytocola sp.]HYQ69059.1 hypothetical protein [Actinophytocola sp.]
MITPGQAVQTYPQLARLFEMRSTPPAWHFTQTLGPDGEVHAVVGVRVWSDGYADSMGILGQEDVQALRVNPNGEKVWKSTDTLAVVLDELAALPAPGQQNAPHLAIAGSVHELHHLRGLPRAQ